MAGLLKKKKERDAKIPDAGMSDIVFLLLLFFLVSTTIDVDTGIGITLPEYQETPDNVVPLSKDRLAALLINENGDVLLDKKILSVSQISETLIPRIESKIELPKKKKSVVSIKTDRRTNYDLFVQAFDQAKLAFRTVRDSYSKRIYGGREYGDLLEEEARVVKDKIPEIISFAEPEKVK